MVAVMVIAFLVAWVPYATLAILKIIAAVRGQSSPVANMKSLTAYLPALLAKSSIIYNPIIYAVCNTQVTCQYLRQLWYLVLQPHLLITTHFPFSCLY
jgi:c-opsin